MLPKGFKSISAKRWLAIASGALILVALPFLGISAYYGYDGLPDSLFFRRTARHYCINCGSQAVSHITSVFECLQLATEPKVVQSPLIEGIDPSDCEHRFFAIASSDRYVDFKSFRLKRWSYGKLEGDPFWSSAALVHAFATLSRTNVEDSGQLFSYLLAMNYKGRVSGKLLEVVTGTNVDEVISALYQVYTNSGMILPSQRKKK
jgi:hypothetical protein